jgi:hypothetical protein
MKSPKLRRVPLRFVHACLVLLCLWSCLKLGQEILAQETATASGKQQDFWLGDAIKLFNLFALLMSVVPVLGSLLSAQAFSLRAPRDCEAPSKSGRGQRREKICC